MSNKLILFFSPNNEDSIDIWKLLKKKNILNTLIKINVDDPDNNIPKYINVLPSIFVRGSPILKGKDSIISYFNLNTVDNSNNDDNTDNSISKTLPPLKDVPFSKQNEAMFLNSNEMGSNWSDNYSFINTDDNIQKHSFTFLNSDNKDNNGKNVKKTSNKKSVLDSRMEEMMNERNKVSAINRV
jgi:hypothetical protein